MTAMRPLMVLGCTSDAGKSLLATALCRWFARQGISVAPFKAQNMSNNVRVVAGGEVGLAQWLQGCAAGVEPTVDMNPVIVKPESDTSSQVVVRGRARLDISALPWQERAPALWEAITEAYSSVAAAHDLVVLEGAGSPAEINLVDQVNNRIIEHADATGLLVADIDRGGAFAHLFGTWALAPATTRERLFGFAFNKFRGDPELLAPGPEWLERETGVPTVGVVPMVHHRLPTEEGAATPAVPANADAPRIAICRFPFGSNLDEFHLLDQVAHVRWATTSGDLDGADLIVLPGSKHVAADRAWLSDRGLDDAIVAAARSGVRVVGVCGGCMMLGGAIEDEAGVDGTTAGLGLVDLSTTFAADKRVVRTTERLAGLPEEWAELEGVGFDGYEVRHGRIEGSAHVGAASWARGPVLATAVHGLFENARALDALFGGATVVDLEATFDDLADLVDEHLDTTMIRTAVERGADLRHHETS
ncbi:MAG: cobyric acid synthase [Actinomycetota bacterium]